MKYEDIKKMGEAYAQVQEKMRQENAKRAEAMLKDSEATLSAQKEAYGAPSSQDDNDQVAQRKKLMKGQKNHDEDASNDKSDDGDGMDKVDKKAAKKKFKDRKDKDIDNDGDVDSSDEYLHKRRKAISKNSESKGKKEVEVQTQEMIGMTRPRPLSKKDAKSRDINQPKESLMKRHLLAKVKTLIVLHKTKQMVCHLMRKKNLIVPQMNQQLMQKNQTS